MAGDDHAEQKPMIMEPIETAIAAKTWSDQINSYTTASNVNSSQDYPSEWSHRSYLQTSYDHKAMGLKF